MAEDIEVSRVIHAPARRLYEAWLDPEEHALMTGAATSAGDDGAYTAWDGYIEGKTVKAEPYTRIEQTWRTNEFPQGHPDSHLVVEFTEVDGGTQVKLVHQGLPDTTSDGYVQGWEDFYFDPMQLYFASAREKVKEVGEELEQAATRATEAFADAAHKAGEAFEEAKGSVQQALSDVRAGAQKQAKKALKQGKAVKKQVSAKARALGKKVQALVKGQKPKPAAKKKVSSKAKGAVKKKTSRTARR